MATEIISGILQTLITEIGQKLVHKIKNQLTHLCCSHFYIQRLTEEVQKLEIERETVQQAVDVALRNLESIRPDVKDWLTRVDDWLITSHKILDKARCDRNSTTGKRCFLKWLPMVHYSLSVEAQKEVDALVQLQIAPGRFDKVSHPLNPADLQPVLPSMSEILLGSRALLEKQVMDALEDDAVYLIGLCGMGGVGKTTIATKMKNWAKSSSMFEVVLFTVISQRLDIKEVQKQIAEGLGLTLEEHSQNIRAEKIHTRLKAAKSFLIIFDDVWERLDLAKIGIPSKSTTEKRKLILTSRIQDALITLTNDCHKIFTVNVLLDEEAWKLFREKAGDSVEAPELVESTKQVAEQCKGLPLALAVVGSALRDKSKGIWEDALIQLKRSHMPSNISRVLEDLYVPLKWSYEQLPSEEARYIFLLCCLFPEDYEIPTETLVRFGWGLGIFNDIETMREARDRVSFLVDVLKCRFLLTQAENKVFLFGTEESVKVHDIIRDMGISIACKDRHVFMESQGYWPRKTSYENITHIYVELNGKPALPETLNCPRLEFLHIKLYSNFEGDIPEKFFSDMKDLKVLSACKFKATKLPSSISQLRKLRGIYLEDCFLGKMESIFENMVNLEIISLRHSSFEVLPREIGQLKHLKVLDLSHCGIISIEFGVISRLFQLEELLMFGSEFLKEEEDEERRKVLTEIGSSSNLANLQIYLNPMILSLDQPFLPKLERFVLVVTEQGKYFYVRDNADYLLYKKIALISYMEVVPIMNFILQMIRNVEFMMIEGDCCIGILNELANIKFQELKVLCLAESKKLEYLVVPTAASQTHKGLDKKGVMEIFCSNLEVLKIYSCDGMKHIFWEQEEEGGIQIAVERKITFLRLRKIKLEKIPEMEVLFKSIEEIVLPALEELEIVCLYMLTKFVSTPNYNTDDDQFFFGKKITCPNLKSLILEYVNCNGIFNYNSPEGYFNLLENLHISSCCELKNVMTPSLSKCFKNLESQCIKYCGELEEVIMPDKHKKGGGVQIATTNQNKIKFLRLRKIKLDDIPEMEVFCNGIEEIELPALEKLIIMSLPKMTNFASTSNYNINDDQFFFSKKVICPNLKTLQLHEINSNGIFNYNIPEGYFNRLKVLRICSCKKLKNVMAPSLSKSLKNLKCLDIENCEELEEVIMANQDEEGQTNTKQILFPQLRLLELSNLPKMYTFCHMTVDLELPSLEVRIEKCPLLKTFSLGSLSCPNINVSGIQDPSTVTKIFFHK